MRVLLTNITLAGRTGTEIVVRDLALGLKRTGHDPVVYSPRLGPLADEMRAAGVAVVDDIAAAAPAPDVIHGHHAIQTAVACARFPGVPCVFVRHDAEAWHDRAPKLSNIGAHAAVNAAFVARVAADAAVPPEAVRIMPNAVDLDRFAPGPALPERPRRALAFAKNTGHLEAVTEACAARGIAVDTVGAAVGRIEARPEALLCDYDLIFTSALSALEALSAGRAVVVCDGRGLAGLATAERFDRFRRFNFGLGLFDRPLTAEAVGAEIDRYDAVDAARVRDRVRAEAGLEAWIGRWLDLYADIAARPVPAPDPALWAAHLQAYDPSAAPPAWLQERASLLEHQAALQAGLAPVGPGAVSPMDGTRVALSGFHPPEPWGLWSAGARTAIRLRLAQEFHLVRARLRVAGFVTPSRPAFRIDWLANGRPAGSVTLTDAEPRWIDLPLDLIAGEETLWLTARSDPARSPSELGVSADPRALGYALMGLELI